MKTKNRNGACAWVSALVTAVLISYPAFAINTDLPGFDDGITRIAQSSETIDEKGQLLRYACMGCE